jgi:transcriptional regulator of acetoin/glycerol metabolism
LRIEIPPLRERGEDSQEIAAAHAQTLGFQLTAGALRAIANYEWPGNVRQLRHCVQAASLHAHDGRIGETAIGDVIATHGGVRTSGDEDVRGLDAAWRRALKTLEKMGRFGAWDFARAAGLSRRSAQRYVVQLVGAGRIVRVGAGRATRYCIRS